MTANVAMKRGNTTATSSEDQQNDYLMAQLYSMLSKPAKLNRRLSGSKDCMS